MINSVVEKKDWLRIFTVIVTTSAILALVAASALHSPMEGLPFGWVFASVFSIVCIPFAAVGIPFHLFALRRNWIDREYAVAGMMGGAIAGVTIFTVRLAMSDVPITAGWISGGALLGSIFGLLCGSIFWTFIVCRDANAKKVFIALFSIIFLFFGSPFVLIALTMLWEKISNWL